ncbi:hypothetical protein HII28_03080 [Planctomonas sp. JC2975]|uniref:DUF6993 domain-containing protein n=1 Tax=Planctomonas sp. JC2975 TaxID=2729626 RepID=UPI00147341D0|nr:hypothetical protein [Planctomonas sp. JC2975]NNC10864.1 hypothetical protein [Planctomonas sp. JC2975]
MVVHGGPRFVRTGVMGMAVAAALVAVLAGCTAPSENPATASTTGTPSPTATKSGVPDVLPTLDPKASATKNLDFFDYVNNRTIAGNQNPSAQQFVDALAAAGFAKSDMQMTADKTTVNLAPGSVQFSVLINGGCLIGQFGTDIGGYHSVVAPALSTGKCLIGDTVPIQ